MIRYCIDDGCKRKIESSKMADKKKSRTTVFVVVVGYTAQKKDCSWG